MSSWDLFSSHGLVLIYFYRNPRARLRDAAAAIGITERAVQNNIRDLSASGHLLIEKVGRCNRYKVMGRKHLPHPTTRSVPLRQLLRLFKADGLEEKTAPAPVKVKKKVVIKPKPEVPQVVNTPEPEPIKAKAKSVEKAPKEKPDSSKSDTTKDPKLPQQDLLF